jgi:Cu(I)/Ag(I) efflux system membrane fusion protein
MRGEHLVDSPKDYQIINQRGSQIMAIHDTEIEVPEADEVVVVEPRISGRQKFRMLSRTVMNRLRFLAVLAGIGLFLGNWDTIKNHWDRWTHPRAAAVRQLTEGQEFFCPMDPQVTRSGYEPNGDVPNCPICGMPLSTRAKGQKEDLPPGVTGQVTLSPERVQMAGIKTVTIGYRPVSKQIKTVGFVTFDETGLSRIVSRVDGYVDKLYADKTYAMVHKGDPLAEIYSPELYSTARELVLSSKVPSEAELVASARRKLVLLGVSPEDIDRMITAGEASRDIVIRSPRTGHVIEKKIEAGASVEAKMTLFEVADLSTVWIEADVYENDAPFIHAGQEITAKVESYPNRVFKGRIALVHPHLEEATRTNRIRIRLDNPNHELRPGMYAEVTIDTPLETIDPYKSAALYSTVSPGERPGAALSYTSTSAADAHPQQPTADVTRGLFLTVPESAVIDTGEKKIVYVERAEGQYEGREVELGPRQDNFYPVLKGLSAGDKVAAAGSFLIDAETRLNPAAASTYFGATGGEQSGGTTAPAMQKPSGETMTDVRPKPFVSPSPEDLKNINQLPEEDRKLANAQGICPITGNPLGTMGVPVKITLRGKTVFVCCKNCIGKAKRDPDGTLKKLERKP